MYGRYFVIPRLIPLVSMHYNLCYPCFKGVDIIILNITNYYLAHYLARAVPSPEPDLEKTVVSDFVQSLFTVCP